MNPTHRFSNRVDAYVRYRPGYPPQTIDLMRSEMGLNENSVIADVGFGTGIFAKMLLQAAGCTVYAVEPNAAMREAGIGFLQEFGKFKSVNGTAENTGLSDQSVDFVTAAQAFHWFDPKKARKEFTRILRRNGFVVLIWNVRELDANAFSLDYENLLREFGTDYEEVAHRHANDQILRDFFSGDLHQKTFENSQTFDFESLQGRLLSSSYIPTEDDPKFALMIDCLKQIFLRHKTSEDTVKIFYKTQVYYGQLN